MQKILARGIAASCALAALAAAGPALGGEPVLTSFSASFELGGKIGFVLEKDKNRKIHDIAITEMVADCGGNRGELNFDIFGQTKVLADRSFAVRSEDVQNPKAKAVVRGQFSRKFKRAKGTARLYGKFNLGGDGLIGCESGKQKFKAAVTG